MVVLILSASFVLGTAIGSFLNVLIFRIPRDEPIAASRSYCPHCRKKLEWRELIPLLSFLAQGGKCRSCARPISLQYPLVELATGILFAFVVFQGLRDPSINRLIDPTVLLSGEFLYLLFEIGYWLFIVSVLIVIFVTDLRYYIIPDKITFPAIGIALGYNLFSHLDFGFDLSFGFWNLALKHPFISSFLAALFVSFFFLALVVVSRGRWMGLGDVKFALFMGLVLGFPHIFVALFLAFTLGSVVGILLIMGRRGSLESQLPFGTFLALTTFIALFWGNTLFNFYWNVIL